MKGYELIADMSLGKIKENTKFKINDSVLYAIYKNGELLVQEDCEAELVDITDVFDLKKILEMEYEIPKSQEWKPMDNENYWFVDRGLRPDWYTFFEKNDYQNYLTKHNKVFETEKEAEEYADYLKAIAERTYKFSKEEWEDRKLQKWIIYYNAEDKKMKVTNYWTTNNFEKFTFKTKEEAQAFIDEFGDKILKYEI